MDAKTGIITTVAGDGQTQDFSGLTGTPAQTAIGAPNSIVVSPSGDVFWTSARRVFKLDSNGALSVVAGDGSCVFDGDGGPVVLASLRVPFGIALDQAGDLYVGESGCNCVRRVSAATGLIQTVAGTGTGTAGTSGDSIPATAAAPTPGVVALGRDTLYVVDDPQSDHARIRAVTPPVPPAMPQPPKITGLLDAADLRPVYSPGTIVSVFGNYLAGPTQAREAIGPDGRIKTALAGD